MELTVGRRHGCGQGQSGTQLAFDGGLCHDGIERLGDSLSRHRSDQHAQPVLIQHEVIVKIVLHLASPAQQAVDVKLISLLPHRQFLG